MALQLYSASLYRLLGTTLRSLVFGTSAAVLVMLLTFLGSGFLILRDQIPRGWKWMFWVSPLQYAFTGLANNEFLGSGYDRIVTVGGEERRFGDVVMDEYQFLQGNKYRCVILQNHVTSSYVNKIRSHSHLPKTKQPSEPSVFDCCEQSR